MPRAHYTGGGTYRVAGHSFEPGDEREVDRELATYLRDHDDFKVTVEKGSTGESDDVDGSAEDEADEDGDETVFPADEPPFDPAEHTVDEIETLLEENDYDEPKLLALYSAEAEAGERQTALAAIEDAEDELED